MVNTAVLIYAVTPFEKMLSSETIGQVQAILIADAVTAPSLKLLNIYQHVSQRFMAPKALTQEKMNTYFRGGYWDLAERYTVI